MHNEHWFAELNGESARWLITGGGGFIGSHLAETLLHAGQQVVVLDNFSTGHERNLAHLTADPQLASQLTVINGDIRSREDVKNAMQGARFVLHQAALGSVPRSIKQPEDSFANNVDGFFSVLDASRQAGVEQFVYASSSSVYGDHPDLPKVEHAVGQPLSPYAATKASNELFARVYAYTYQMKCVGLRYFNVFGPRQDPNGPYAAVIPRWAAALLAGEPVQINGDGETTRDFCFVANAVQANIRAALAPLPPGTHEVFNVAFGEQTSLNELFTLIRENLATARPSIADATADYRPFREGDIRHSLADISSAASIIGYQPTHSIRQGLETTLKWYLETNQ